LSAGSRKAAKRTFPWDLQADEIELVLPPPQREVIPARKKPRHEEPTPPEEAATKISSHAPTKGRERPLPVIDIDKIVVAIPILPNGLLGNCEEDNGLHVAKSNAGRSEDARKTASPETAVGIPPPAADHDDANADAAASRAPSRPWKKEEDVKLTEAVNKHGKEWVAVAAMVPDRTNRQCRVHWVQTCLDPANGKSTGEWTPEEYAKLREAVNKHGKEWVAIAAMVPDRNRDQCRQRWVDADDPASVKNTGK
jgi:hypothetical protein